ncbi:MAG: EAL domain-containing protein [Betaproteobacteria bacterium]|nr:EAL domain-containing protein [Betaproteobacteria bacterium]
MSPYTDTYRSLKRHSLWLLVAFFLAWALIEGRSLHERVADRDQARRVHGWAETSADISLLVHELQKERGLSNGYLASHGLRFSAALEAQIALTDCALTALEMTSAGGSGEPGELAVAVRPLLAGLHQLPGLRQQVIGQTLSRDVVVERYTGTISRLFEAMSANLVADNGMLRSQLAFVAFLQAKEMAGQERALLTAILTSGNFGSFSRMAAYHRIRAVEEAHLQRFRQFAEEDGTSGLDAIAGQPFNAEAEAIRRRVVAAGHGAYTRDSPNLALPGAERWFELSSKKIEAMKSLEDVIRVSVKRGAEDVEQRAVRGLVVHAVSLVVALLLAGVLLMQLRRSSRAAEEKLGLASAVFSNSLDAIVITDAQQSIVDINAAFTQTTGYGPEEALGAHVRMLKSGRHDDAFYDAMWRKLMTDGGWEGEVWNRRKNGDIYPALLSIVAVKDAPGAIANYIATVVDLSLYKRTEALLEQLRTFDPLTGLLGRDAWISAMDRAIANARGAGGKFSVLELGLDRFKLINDSLSHAVGDRVLVEAAERVRHSLRRQDAAARPGGDRFSIVLEEIGSAQDVGAICEKLLAAFLTPICVGEHQLGVSVSMGVVFYPDDGTDAGTLQRNAEAAMYRAKDEGRACYKFYSADMNLEGARLLALERRLRLALEREELSVCYQPQVDAGSGRLVGVEALVRWNNPELGPVSPVQFIPVAEETGLIVPIGRWVMLTACRQARHWLDELGSDLPVAVNLSARQFRQHDLLVDVQSVLDESGLPSRLLELEVTEGLLIADPEGAADVMRGLRAMGLRIALDDFGTGYSSLAYLKIFPLDRLKIDRAFVDGLPDNESDTAISRTIIALGLNLGMEVLAEGVETQAQGDFLAAAGCQVFQGYHYGKPMAGDELLEKIRAGVFPLARPGFRQEGGGE